MDCPFRVLEQAILQSCFQKPVARFPIEIIVIAQVFMEYFCELIILDVVVTKKVNIFNVFSFFENIIIFSLVNNFVITFPVNFFRLGNNKLHQVQFISFVIKNRRMVFLFQKTEKPENPCCLSQENEQQKNSSEFFQECNQ